MLSAFNLLQQQAGAALNGGTTNGLTASNARRVVLADKEVVTPDEWVPLALEHGFADCGPPGYGAAGVRKDATGRVEIRECVSRAAGAPAAFTVITTLPAGYAPMDGIRRTCEASSNTLGGYEVLSTGAVRWLFGDPTSDFTFSGGSWMAADRSLPPWPTPFKVALNLDGKVSVREVWVVARASSSTETGLTMPTVCQAPSIERTAGGGNVLVLPRIDGLRPLTRYRLTLWAFLE